MKTPTHWQGRGVLAWALRPVSVVFGAVAALRRWAYRGGLLASTHPDIPVVVVGNITAGGSGKTPLVIALVKLFRAQGLRVGVVSRGYGAAKSSARLVDAQSDPATVGDEPVLIATRAKCPVAVGVRRIEAALLLAERDDVDVIVTDDGLQHYALQRDVEIAVVDQRTGLGNGWLLPAGPLREPPWRHETVDYVVTNGDASGFDVMPTGVYRVDGESDTRQIADFSGSRVNAVAGIAQPDKFFALLQSLGMKLNTRVFADHHHFVPTDLQFDNEHDTLMTEKDAVKCKGFAGPEVWALRIDAVLAREWSDDLLRQVTNLVAHYARDRHA